MAAQSVSQKGGFKRRLTKSRSPIRTRSRSRNLAQQEIQTVSSSSSSAYALEYTLKRKQPHRLEPLLQSEKSKTKRTKSRKKQCAQKKIITRTGKSNMSTNINFPANFIFKSASVEDNSVIRVECLITVFKVEHNLPVASADYVGPLLKKMFPKCETAWAMAQVYHSAKNESKQNGVIPTASGCVKLRSSLRSTARYSEVLENESEDISSNQAEVDYQSISSDSSSSQASFACSTFPLSEEEDDVHLVLDSGDCSASYINPIKPSSFVTYSRLPQAETQVLPVSASASNAGDQIISYKSNGPNSDSQSSEETVTSQGNPENLSRVIQGPTRSSNIFWSQLPNRDDNYTRTVEPNLDGLRSSNNTSHASEEDEQIEKSIFATISQTERNLQRAERIRRNQVETNSCVERVSDKTKVQVESGEPISISDQARPIQTRITGSCTSSRGRHPSRVIKLPSSSSAVEGGTSRQTVVRATPGMSSGDSGQEIPSNPFAPDGNSLETPGNAPALLEARGLPPHLFGALGPRMQHLLHRSMGTTASNRAHQLLQSLQAVDDEVQQLQAVMEMCQILVMGNEDTLAGFPVKQVVPVLITLLTMEHNFELMNHACRALTYMMDALPRSSTVVVEAVPVFLEKLQFIQCMDVAEQSLTALEMLSRRHSKIILHARGVVRSSLHLLSARLTVLDKKSIENVCLAFSRLIDCFQFDGSYLNEIALSGLLANIQQLLVLYPPIFNSGTFVNVIRMLTILCATCPELAVVLLKDNIPETLRFLLMGNPENTDEIELIPRSPPELFEITSLIGELMPRLPSDGIFAIDSLMKPSNPDVGMWQWRDDRGMWHPYTSIDNKILETAHLAGEDEVSLSAMGKTYTIDFNASTQTNDDSGTSRPIQRRMNSVSGILYGSDLDETSDYRIHMFQANPALAETCIKSLFAVLYEVYNCSAGPAVRHKCLRALLRMIYFASSDLLQTVLKSKTVASNIASMLASHDLRVVVAALQMADILMRKLPSTFGILFRREGVMHYNRILAKLDTDSDSDQSKENSNAPPDVFANLPPLIPIGSASALASFDGNHSAFGPSILPVSASDLSSDNAMHFPGGGLWGSSSSVATTFEGIQPSTSSSVGADESHNSNTPQLKLSDVLKRKRTPKRTCATSRKVRAEETTRDSVSCSAIRGLGQGVLDNAVNPILGSSALTLSACTPSSCNNSTNNASPEMGGITNPASCSNNSSTATPGRGKLSSAAAKTSSFLASLNPTRWSRWSSSSPVNSRLSAQDPCMMQRTSTDADANANGNKAKIKAWIKEQAKNHQPADVPGLLDPAMNVLNQLTTSVSRLRFGGDTCLEAMFIIRNIIMNSDTSCFEVMHSGLVKKFIMYLWTPRDRIGHFGCFEREERLRTFLHVFVGLPISATTRVDTSRADSAPLAALVNKLNACISQLEQFAVNVHDLPGASNAGGRGTVLRFFNTHQLRCNLKRHPDCVNLKQFQGGPVKIDPLAMVQAIERYLVIRGYGRTRGQEEDGSEEEISDEDIDDTMAAMLINQGESRHILQFSIGETILSYNITVFQAIKQYGNCREGRHIDGSDTDTDSEAIFGYSDIWNKVHTIWYRSLPNESEPLSANMSTPNSVIQNFASIPGPSSQYSLVDCFPARSKRDDMWHEGIVPEMTAPLDLNLSPGLPDSVVIQDPSLEVISLLRIIHTISFYWGSLYQLHSWSPALPQAEFLNNKLTVKANRQLQDPFAVMTGNIPSWLSQIAYACPFLFPFSTRQLLFYITTFDRDRALQRLYEMTPDRSNNESDRVTPRLDKTKKTIPREDLLKHAEAVMQDIENSKALIEIQYENEVGTGLGPTLEFYSLVSKEFQKGDLDMWRGEKVPVNIDEPGSYMYCPLGLFPMPLAKYAKVGVVARVRNRFRLLGKILAKALMDSRILDIPMSLIFYKWMLGQEENLPISELRYVDESLARTVFQLEQIVMEKKRVENDKSIDPESIKCILESISLDGCIVKDLNLDFTLPGYSNIELRKGGSDIPVTIHNLEEYLQLLTYWTVNEGIHRQMEAFKEGFESVFPLSQLKMFYPHELEYLFCGSSHTQWDVDTFVECVRTDHGYSLDSRAIKFLFQILCSYNQEQQRKFLQFLTGSPRLPVGGIKSLNPPFTIVRKTVDEDENPDEYLPSVMTCVNYLKLPDYSTIDIMREKLHIAAYEGQNSFYLS
ncbi:e3 ubiquitin-protein ligase TRIP12 [Caerostris extrusa]|uniref:E3 ubiquitin-protein ligase n=1 Tax=Caerostris extrusa TaxID=172846 RepID=A0AAV4S8P0_CAEEX|nr:e3 ubiquitin-protein ligase TRIP12 [Caerostris extrusa]